MRGEKYMANNENNINLRDLFNEAQEKIEEQRQAKLQRQKEEREKKAEEQNRKALENQKKEIQRKTNTENYANSLKQFIKDLMINAAQHGEPIGIITPNDFEKYNLGKLKKDRNFDRPINDFSLYTSKPKDNGCFRNYDSSTLKQDLRNSLKHDKNAFESPKYYEIDKDKIHVVLNFSEQNNWGSATDDSGKLIDMDMDYLNTLLNDDGIYVQLYSGKHIDDYDNSCIQYLRILEIYYYNNTLDRKPAIGTKR